ncbi:MAG: hypothetical protein QXU75_09755 [Candidatus Methanomethylicaceae archaeon]
MSSVTKTLVILGKARTTAAESVPFISQSLQIFSYEVFYIAQFFATIAVIFSQHHIGVKPKLCALVLAVYMHVTWFATVI